MFRFTRGCGAALKADKIRYGNSCPCPGACVLHHIYNVTSHCNAISSPIKAIINKMAQDVCPVGSEPT